MSYGNDYALVDYEYLKENPRTYVGKYFGNDRGLSLKAVIAQGYIDHPGQIPQVFESNPKENFEYFEYFMNGIDNRRVTQKFLSERERSWPHKYYSNIMGHSLRAITKDEGIKEIEQMKGDYSLNPKYPITRRYGTQGTIKDLPSKEGYSNYNRRPFRDGYKILQKTAPIRSGPFKYNSNRMGHSLRAVTQSGAGLVFSN